MYKFSSQRLVRFVSDDDPVGARHGSLDGGMMFVPVINSVYNRPQWTLHFIQAIGADIERRARTTLGIERVAF